MKISIAEMKLFMEETDLPENAGKPWAWPPNFIIGESYREDGLDWCELPDHEIVDPDDFGDLIVSSRDHEDPTNGDGYKLSTFIRRWQKDKTTDTFVVTIPKEQREGFLALMKAHKWKAK